MTIPCYGKRAPNEEALQSALQLRQALFSALEAAMDNDWSRVKDQCETAALLAMHCHKQENGGPKKPGLIPVKASHPKT